MHFAIDEDDVRDLDRCPVLARRSRLEVTGAETQRGAEEIRAELLESQPVGIEAVRTSTDQVLFGHLAWAYAPIGQPVEHEEHHQPDDE